MRCKIGRHTCDDMKIENKILSEAGLYWFCDDCNQQFMKEYISKLDKNAHFKGFKENDENDKEKGKAKKEETAKIKDKKQKKPKKYRQMKLLLYLKEYQYQAKNKKRKAQLTNRKRYQAKNKKRKGQLTNRKRKKKSAHIGKIEVDVSSERYVD